MAAIGNPRVKRVLDDAKQRELDIIVQVLGSQTQNTVEMARSCECDLAQIAKSLVFTERGGNLALVLISAENMQDSRALAARLGARFRPADPKLVYDVTGFEAGSVSPLAILVPIPIHMDATLFDYETIWCCAGRPDVLLRVNPHALQQSVNAEVLHTREPQ